MDTRFEACMRGLMGQNSPGCVKSIHKITQIIKFLINIRSLQLDENRFPSNNCKLLMSFRDENSKLFC